jgi:hypothetical protein
MRSTVSPIRRGVFAVMALAFTTFLALPAPTYAQSASEQKGSGEKREAVPKRVDEIAEVSRLLAGQPAGNPECVWLGRRVLSRLWVDDLDTAFRHLDLYDRFGCPGGHIQATFRCLVRQGDPDPKAPDALNSRIHTCWINPSNQPATPATTAQSPEAGTTTR